MALFSAATCFVMPSRFEPFGIAYVEAGMAGLASIGTTVGGAATAVGEGGILVNPDDPPALTEAMRILAQPAEAARLGGLAAAHARSQLAGCCEEDPGGFRAAPRVSRSGSSR